MRKFLLICLFNMLIFNVIAQHEYKIDIDSSSIIINGTSTFHDWEASSKDIQGTVEALIDGRSIKNILDADLSMEVISLKSESKGLARRLHKELAYKKFPNISFKFKKLVLLTKDSVEMEGDLRIKGVTKKLILTGKVSFRSDTGDVFLFLGSKKLKMTDFNIKPPTFLFGMFKTGDEVNVNFNIHLINKSMN